jgi:hypothetical protein
MLKIQNAFRSYLRWVWHSIRWFFSAPFQDLPPAFGDTVPPELRAFEAEVNEIQHRAIGMVSSSNGRGHVRSKPRH